MLDSRWLHAFLITAAFLVALVYLGQTAYAGYLGFPLDDAWIHQTYARNLARWGQFAYVRGHVSAGSTSPLWTIVLAVGYLLFIEGRLWAYLMGAICLVLTATIAHRLTTVLWPERQWVALSVAIFCVLEWNLAWAAFSGMEILLFTCLSLLLIESVLRHANPFWIGLLGGLLILTRPEGAVLLLLAVVVSLLPDEERRWRPANMVALFSGLSLLVVPYLTYNMLVSKALFPNTFYAKQSEYSILLANLSLWSRLWRLTRATLIGAQIFLLPGFVYSVGRAVKQVTTSRRNLSPHKLCAPFLPIIWWASLLVIYALRLPVDYQHGRYVMPVIPIFIIYGVEGTAEILRPLSLRIWVRVLSRVLIATTGVLLLAFVFVGGQAYACDVGIIEGEMVNVARWLAANTPADALIAAHDIGAIGYFSERPLLDLAGLVTPEVIPFIRDESRLLDFVQERGAKYLVTFPSWYPHMVQDPHLMPVYRTDCQWTVKMDHDNMVVYQLSPPE